MIKINYNHIQLKSITINSIKSINQIDLKINYNELIQPINQLKSITINSFNQSQSIR